MSDHLQARQSHRLELQRPSSHGERAVLAAADELSLHDARITTPLNHMSQGLCMFDADKKLIVCNEQYARIYGIPPEHVRPGTPFRQILQGRIDSGQFEVGNPEDYLRERIEAVEEQIGSVKIHHLTDGRSIAITHCPLEDGGWVATHDDITDMRRIEARIAHMAHYDGLTDLPNRILFRHELDLALRRGEHLALLCLDLDPFKAVNDALGHPLGDALLPGATGQRDRPPSDKRGQQEQTDGSQSKRPRKTSASTLQRETPRDLSAASLASTWPVHWGFTVVMASLGGGQHGR